MYFYKMYFSEKMKCFRAIPTEYMAHRLSESICHSSKAC